MTLYRLYKEFCDMLISVKFMLEKYNKKFLMQKYFPKISAALTTKKIRKSAIFENFDVNSILV